MGIKERTAALNKRRQAVAVIKNIRKTRRLLAKHPLDEKLFDIINGAEDGIRELIGRKIVFGFLTDSERLSLKIEILKGLSSAENYACDTLRAATVDFFKDLKDASEVNTVAIDQKNITDLMGTKPRAIETFLDAEAMTGMFDYERSMSAIEHIELIAEEVEENTPDVEHELDETIDGEEQEEEEQDEYEEEQHTEEANRTGEEPADPPNDPDPLEPAPEEDPALPIELDEDDDGDEEDDDYDPDSADGDCPTTANVKWVRAEESYLESAMLFVSTEGYSLSDNGFTATRGQEVLSKYTAAMNHYKAALRKLYDVIDPECATIDRLLYGSVNTYKRLNRIMVITEKFGEVRDALNKSCESLIAASKKVLVETIKDPYIK